MKGARRGVGVTTRIIIGVIVLTSLGLLFSAVIAAVVNRQTLQVRIDQSLVQEVAELRALAEEGRDGAQFASVEDLLYEAVRRNVPDQHEDFLVLLDGQVPFVPSVETRFDAELVPELVDAAREVRPDDEPALRTLEAGDLTLRYVAVPVVVTGDSSTGVFVAAVDMRAALEELRGVNRAYAVSAGLVVIVVATIMSVLLWWQLTPVRRLAATAERITEEDLSRRIPEQGADDLARLAHTVNGMLDRLERAFGDQRALLDDVGHELRTPLTVVRGHLEILDPTDDTDVTDTRDLCIDELDRMSGLVDEIVLLARSDRPDFVDPRPTDVDDVVLAALEKSRTLAERVWRHDHRCDAVVDIDAARLTQALLQLVSNAVKHTEPGDEIGVGAARTEDGICVWVRDTGPGIPPGDEQVIFERFRRGSAPVGPGSGLGLSIVSAIAEAHGGTVDHRGMPGAGATFVIDIPITGKEKP
ncbi:MAG: HAMP domain-containing sensor histidine kinase [Mobilicoccus sp.]|nr:HAMP domain-containing sensor histidine kinase [Mobilicoccus sp.]